MLDPRLLPPDFWSQLYMALAHLGVMVGMAVNAALSMALAHAIIPSLVMTRDAPADILTFRRILYPISLASAAVAIYAFARSLVVIVDVIQYMYPRFAI